MARTPTTQIPLGFRAPEFNLPEVVSDKILSLQNVVGEKATVFMFICNHCPFVVHVVDELVRLANDYKEKGVGFVAISANDVANYPEDSPEKMKQFSLEHNFPFPYLFDETQEVARAYDAACTPDFAVFDGEQKCVYRGQLDGARPENQEPNDGSDMRTTLNALLQGEEIAALQKPSIGCNIKWK